MSRILSIKEWDEKFQWKNDLWKKLRYIYCIKSNVELLRQSRLQFMDWDVLKNIVFDHEEKFGKLELCKSHDQYGCHAIYENGQEIHVFK